MGNLVYDDDNCNGAASDDDALDADIGSSASVASIVEKSNVLVRDSDARDVERRGGNERC